MYQCFAVAVLKAARLRYPLNDDLQTYACAVLITLGQKAPEGTQETKCIVNNFKEVATHHSERMMLVEEQIRYVKTRVQAYTDDIVKYKDNEDRPAALVQQQRRQITAAEVSQVSK